MEQTIRATRPEESDWVNAFLEKRWGSAEVITRGRRVRPASLPGLIAEVDGERCGLITWEILGDACEIVSLDSVRKNLGIGSKLVEGVLKVAREAGCQRVWLITTNDNLPALGFYQKRGFSLAALHKGAIAVSRSLKPQIAEKGWQGIPIEHELELELVLK